ncbi:MAG: DUF167 domain-containing protein [Methanobacteriota archaeon]
MTGFHHALIISKKGVLLSIHVTTGSSQTIFPTGYNSWRKTLEIKVRATAQHNQANIEVVHTIAAFFGIPEHDVLITSGQKNKEKTIALLHIDKTCVEKKLEESLHGL